MNSFNEWLAMGGYSAYVWSSYGLVGFVLIMNFLRIKRQRNQTRQKLQRWFKR
ncbi:heme exporter protein CcmD [Legionella worsleiensis]|uniref:Heme exporter protein D n=1 Tax=Legionella worsleiensis TaxID=45076 RepID=A0A0W1A3Q0_9GAMM|nr:heme exporter protein CcmD [Legionella worsleiensis]KTD75982.1 heme exporter protein CcmD [Legionella worsleiensis]STY32995.1 cytochrome c-type biogenesis protein CcmD [Legionella worsleiensis]